MKMRHDPLMQGEENNYKLETNTKASITEEIQHLPVKEFVTLK